MPTTNHPRQLLPHDVQRQPQLPALVMLRAATNATVPALLHAHPALAADRLSTSTEVAADNVVRLAQRLRDAIDNYRRTLTDDLPF